MTTAEVTTAESPLSPNRPVRGTRKRLDHIDAMRPVKQAGVVSTHTLLFFAPVAAGLAVGASLLIAGLGAIAPFGGLAGQGGFAYASAEFVRIALRNRSQAIEDVLGISLVLVLVLWLMRGAVIGPIAPRGASTSP